MAAKKISSSESIQIHKDLWHEILKRLPVKDLCRLRCVCKSWNLIISSPCFISDHLTFTASAATEKSYLQFFRRYPKWDPTWVHYDVYHFQASLGQRMTSFLHVPFRTKHNELSIADVIKGVVCLFSTYKSSRLSSHYSALLWNPTIHRYVEIPRPPSPFHGSPSHTYTYVFGFGFDSSKNDFKVVRICYSKSAKSKLPPIFQVFSLQDHVWKEVVPDINSPVSIDDVQQSFFANGTIHWTARMGSSYVLLLFDCEHERFRTTLELPDPQLTRIPAGHWFAVISVYRYGGMLSLSEFTALGMWYHLCPSEKYSIESGWKQLFRIDYDHQCEGVNGRFEALGNDVFYLRSPVKSSLDCNDPTGQWIWPSGESMRDFYLPIFGRVLEESMFLMDSNNQASSYEIKQDKKGKICYVQGGRLCYYIKLGLEE